MRLLTLVVVSLCLISPSFAQEEGDAPAPSPFVRIANNKKMAAFDGKPMPLLWADGITRVDELPLYKRLGLNTIVVRLIWRANDDGSFDARDLRGPRAFADAAAAQGLKIVYSLPPAPLGMERSFRTTADSEPYFLLWSSWVTGAIETLRDTPNLLGWMLPNDPRALPYADDVGFARWLSANFAGVEVLNKQWKVRFESLEDVTFANTQAVIEQWRGAAPVDGPLTNDEIQARARAQQARQPDRGDFAFHPAALALAQFRWDAYRALMSRWARTIKAIDPLHLVMSGRLPDYAQLLSLPPEVDVVVPDLQPGTAETDLATHNPQAVDIARRAGRFAATPVLTTSPSPVLPRGVLPRAMPIWMDTALAHGASGLVFSSWSDLQEDEALQRAIQTKLADLESTAYFGLWDAAPASTAAVVLTPLADGHTLQIGRNPVTGEAFGAPRGLYGFGDNLVSNEPSDLVYALRWGTAFGSVDYLSPDDISDDSLKRYGTILLPQALSLEGETSQVIGRFVAGGGVAVADLGLGAAQGEWNVLGLSPALSGLFGVAPPISLKTLSFNLQGVTPHELFPTFSSQRTGTQITSGDGPGGAAFNGPMTFGELLPGTIPLALGQRLPQPLTGIRSNAPGASFRFLDSTLSLRPLGAGYAIYAPFRLWNTWRPEHAGFSQFHGDLFARAAAVVQLGASAFVPAPGPNVNNGLPLYPQMVNFPTTVALLNHSPASSSDPADGTNPVDMQFSTLQTPGVGEFLWSNAMCAFPTNGEVAADAPRRPAPVRDIDAFAARPRLVTLHAVIKAQEVKTLRLLPVSAQNTGGGPMMANAVTYNEASVKIALWPNAVTMMPV
ncbi:MAG TPA: hypothetical protein VF719_12375, partial [Abditibacteriaceae bacterium]